MWTLIGLGTGAAFVYSVVATVAPEVFPASFVSMGRVAVYFEAAAVIISLTLLGQVLELKARSQTSAAIKSLLGLAPKTARRLRDDGTEEDVPSPTFTLIQTYPAEVDIWHADLYRLPHPDEVLELGLDEAFQTAICLVEWPERMGSLLPEDAIRLRLVPQGDARMAEVMPGPRPALAEALRRDWGAQ